MSEVSELSTWTNASVRDLATTTDPIETITALANRLLLEAADAGVTGPPTNPLDVAALMGIIVRPRFDIADARLVSEARTSTPSAAVTPSTNVHLGHVAAEMPLAHFVTSAEQLVIEYNPTRPRGRLRYSIAHEIAHALFADAAAEVRQRTHTGAVPGHVDGDGWQLELLCNIAAAELLMPADAVHGLIHADLDIDFLMDQRARLQVSTEAMLRRLVHATDRPVALSAFRRSSDTAGSPVRCDYVLPSRTWTGELSRGTTLGPDTAVAQPVAVGQTARGEVTLDADRFRIQCVGVPPYPGSVLPRVLGLVEPVAELPTTNEALTYVTADIAEAARTPGPGDRPVFIAHVVSDAARAWGKYGVAGSLRAVVPQAAQAFHSWTVADPEHLRLGHAHLVQVTAAPDGRRVWVASLVAQRGFGASASPRLVYVALAEALQLVAEAAKDRGGEVRIPRLGVGQAGGRWDVVEATIERTLLDAGVPTTVYTKPSVGRPSAGKRPNL